MTILHIFMCVMWLAFIALALSVIIKAIVEEEPRNARQHAGEDGGEGVGCLHIAEDKQ